VDSNSFERYVKMLPVSWENALGQGVAFLTAHLNAERVEFEVVNNGVAIGIVCDENDKREAAQFWKEHVEPALDDE